MSSIPNRHRYSEWDGSQEPPVDATAALDALSQDLMEYGDLDWALRNLLSRGMSGGMNQGLRDLMRSLRESRREQLKRFDLSSIMDDIKTRLDDIVARERATTERWLEDNPDGEFSSEVLKAIARRNRDALDALPNDAAGQMKALEQHEFLDTDAQKDYLALLNELREAMTRSFFNNVEQMVQNLSDGDIERMKEMLAALNEMLVRKIAGEDPQFDAFMARFGDMFGDPPPATLDELLEQMRQQMAAAQSLLNSMSSEQRQQLSELMNDRLGDPELNAAMRALAKELDFLNPDGARYDFSGRESIDLRSALDLMNEMSEIDRMIDQLGRAEREADLSGIDQEALRKLLGDEAVQRVGDLQQIMDALKEAGYLRGDRGDGWELTPRGSRAIGQRALLEIYQRLKRQSLGNHAVPEEGRFGERIEQTKPYEFGDPFHLHMPETIRNALLREGSTSPVRLQPEDFAIYRSETLTSTATAMLVDLSWSMALRGSFASAKRVALALHNLITSQYPKDSFYLIGFAAYANQLQPKDLPYLLWDEHLLGTNMQHALLLAEKLLGKHSGATKQVIMISDGEPTAHLEDGESIFAYPPTPDTLRATLSAVKRCTKKGIAINTFMLDAGDYLRAFMDQIARINGGRVFYTDSERLGEYILVDYVQHKKTSLRGRG
ncbi:MAG: VWA domain-containing protein [Pseudomonadota bacterium]